MHSYKFATEKKNGPASAAAIWGRDAPLDIRWEATATEGEAPLACFLSPLPRRSRHSPSANLDRTRREEGRARQAALEREAIERRGDTSAKQV